jgi:hypothetical protein
MIFPLTSNFNDPKYTILVLDTRILSFLYFLSQKIVNNCFDML